MGFPSPADDFIETKLDLNRLLIHHPATTFFMRMGSDTLKTDGIFRGDLLIVDRSINPYHNAVTVLVIDGELIIKRFTQEVLGAESYEVWGVVTSVIHNVKI